MRVQFTGHVTHPETRDYNTALPLVEVLRLKVLKKGLILKYSQTLSYKVAHNWQQHSKVS